MFPILGTHVGGKSVHQLDELWTPDNPQDLNDTTWTSHVRAEAIWEALITQGKLHFSQASDTPFASGPIADLIGPLEYNDYAKQILNGTFDIDSITDDLEVRDIVRAMAHSDPSNPLQSDTELTVEKLKEGFSYVKESTSSNPEGLHHGHWKSLIQDDDAFEPFALIIMFAFKWGEPHAACENALQIVLRTQRRPTRTDQEHSNPTDPACLCRYEYGIPHHLGPRDATASRPGWTYLRLPIRCKKRPHVSQCRPPQATLVRHLSSDETHCSYDG